MNRTQLVRGNTAFNNAFIGNEGEFTVDIQLKEIRVHDGVTPGGKRVPNIDTIPTLSRQVFTAVATKGTATDIPAADIDKMLTLSAAGNHILPDRSTLAVGAHFWLHAAVAGVVIQAHDAGQQIIDRGVLGQTRAMNQFDTMHIALIGIAGSSAWRVLSVY